MPARDGAKVSAMNTVRVVLLGVAAALLASTASAQTLGPGTAAEFRPLAGDQSALIGRLRLAIQRRWLLLAGCRSASGPELRHHTT